MTTVHAAVCAINQTPLDWDGNAARIREGIRLARASGARIVCFPELCISGYGCEDAFLSAGLIETAWDVLESLAGDSHELIIAVGLPVAYRDQLFNGAALLVDGRIVGLVGKQNLAGEGLHYEPRWFRPWPNNLATTLEREGRVYPWGDLIFDCGGVRIGFEICEDAWVLARPGGELARMGVDLILNPSASHFAFGKHEVRERLVVEGSRAFQAAYLYANHLGNESGRALYDGDCLIASNGQLIQSGPRFGYRDVYVSTAEIDLAKLRAGRIRPQPIPVDDPQELSRVISVDYTLPFRGARHVGDRTAADVAVIPRSLSKEEEFTRAVALALFDYMRKSRSHGFVVSLSGGADSSAVAVLIYCMVRLALAELGGDEFRRKLHYLPEPATDAISWVHRLLTCVYQATRNSSNVTRDSAQTVARGIAAEYLEAEIDSLVDAYVSLIESAIGRQLTWHADDVPLQNVQARARAPSVWLLANLRQALLLSTSNRSEAAVGYATMDGDTCGGLAPIAGIDKAFLRTWLQWMESTGPVGIGPLPFLECVNRQEPTAELRPPEMRQSDEDDLMPYRVLDAIERAAIRDKLTPWQCYLRLAEHFPDYSAQQRAAWIDRFFRLWCRNQWKRERYAPSFHLDDESVDPKTWCRFPILSGGYERELREMWERIPAS